MEPIFDRTLIADRRRRALAKRAAGADFLMKRIAEDLAARLSVVERRFEHAAILDDETGRVEPAIAATGKAARIEQAGFEAPSQQTAASEQISLAPGSADLVISALSLHLVNDTPGVLAQIRRALRPDGLLLAAVPGAGTLQELRESLIAGEAEITGGASPRVIPFADVRDYGALLQRAGFALPVADIDKLTVRYDTLFHLMLDLRAMGMTNPLVGRSRVPVGRRFFERAAEIYAERFSDPDGRIRATFAIVNLSGWAPHESQQKPLRPGSAKARLAHALGTTEKKV